jgi:hypothetical protein
MFGQLTNQMAWVYVCPTHCDIWGVPALVILKDSGVAALVSSKFKMSKKNQNLALKNQLKIMASYSIQHERLDFMEI